jgi:CRP-like cAMP-binding protein
MSIREALGPEGIAKLEAAGERLQLEPGVVLAEPGDPIDELSLILSGAVEVFIVLDGGVERLVGTLRDRGLLGAMALTEPMVAQARARTCEPTEILRIHRDALHKVLDDDLELAVKVMPALIAQLGKQARIAAEDLVNTAQWAAQVSGITQTSFADLLTGADGVVFRLVDGRSLRGRVLRIEPMEGAGFIVLDDGEGTVHVIRAPAIVSMERPPVEAPSA